MEDNERAEVVSVMKAVILPNKGGLALHRLPREYSEINGTCIPYRKFGFPSLEAFIQSIPEIRMGKDHEQLLTINDPKTAHLSKMVAAQKCTKKRPKMTARKFGVGNKPSMGYGNRSGRSHFQQGAFPPRFNQASTATYGFPSRKPAPSYPAKRTTGDSSHLLQMRGPTQVFVGNSLVSESQSPQGSTKPPVKNQMVSELPARAARRNLSPKKLSPKKDRQSYANERKSLPTVEYKNGVAVVVGAAQTTAVEKCSSGQSNYSYKPEQAITTNVSDNSNPKKATSAMYRLLQGLQTQKSDVNEVEKALSRSSLNDACSSTNSPISAPYEASKNNVALSDQLANCSAKPKYPLQSNPSSVMVTQQVKFYPGREDASGDSLKKTISLSAYQNQEDRSCSSVSRGVGNNMYNHELLGESKDRSISPLFTVKQNNAHNVPTHSVKDAKLHKHVDINNPQGVQVDIPANDNGDGMLEGSGQHSKGNLDIVTGSEINSNYYHKHYKWFTNATTSNNTYQDIIENKQKPKDNHLHKVTNANLQQNHVTSTVRAPNNKQQNVSHPSNRKSRTVANDRLNRYRDAQRETVPNTSGPVIGSSTSPARRSVAVNSDDGMITVSVCNTNGSERSSPPPIIEQVDENLTESIWELDSLKLLLKPKFCGFQLIGDNFLLSLTREKLGVPCQFIDGKLFRCGLCISGLTLGDCYSEMKSQKVISDKVVLLLGAIDILMGNSFYDLQHNMLGILACLMDKFNSSKVCICTIPRLLTASPEKKHTCSQFNDWIRRISTNSKRFYCCDLDKKFSEQDGFPEHSFYNECLLSVELGGSTVDLVLWNQKGHEVVLGELKKCLP